MFIAYTEFHALRFICVKMLYSKNQYNNLVLYLAIATIYSLFDHVYKYMGDQLCAKKILNNHWISGVPILKGLIRILKSLKFCLVNTETTVKFIWSSVNTLFLLISFITVDECVLQLMCHYAN